MTYFTDKGTKPVSLTDATKAKRMCETVMISLISLIKKQMLNAPFVTSTSTFISPMRRALMIVLHCIRDRYECVVIFTWTHKHD